MKLLYVHTVNRTQNFINTYIYNLSQKGRSLKQNQLA